VIPLPTDNVVDRGKKAILSICQEKEIEKLFKRLTEHLAVLVFHSTVPSKSGAVEGKRIIVNSLPFEGDPDYLDRLEITGKIDQALESQNRVVFAGLGGLIPSKGISASY